MGSELDLQEEA
jgi:hypothetical protein